MKNKQYWAKRNRQRKIQMEKESLRQEEKLDKYYKEAIKQINKMVLEVYDAYSEKTGLGATELAGILTGTERKNFIAKIKERMELLGLVPEDVYNKEILSKLTRLEALKERVFWEMKNLQAKQDIQMTASLKEEMEKSYDLVMQDYVGKKYMPGSFTRFQPGLAEEVLKEKWAGGNYSERIWDKEGKRSKMAKLLPEKIAGSLISGQSYFKTARQIREEFGVMQWEAMRLVRTESAFVTGQTSKEGMLELGIGKYTLDTTLDKRTSKICLGIDESKVYDYEEAVPGKNFQPFHPNCRTIDSPLTSEEALVKKMEKYVAKQEVYTKQEKEQVPPPEKEVYPSGYKSAFDFVLAKQGAKRIPGLDRAEGPKGIYTLALDETDTKIFMPAIGTKEKGTGLGTEIMNQLKEYSDSTKKVFTVVDVYNEKFFDKFKWLEKKDGETYIYSPLDNEIRNQIKKDIPLKETFVPIKVESNTEKLKKLYNLSGDQLKKAQAGERIVEDKDGTWIGHKAVDEIAEIFQKTDIRNPREGRTMQIKGLMNAEGVPVEELVDIVPEDEKSYSPGVPIDLIKTEDGYLVIDGQHRVVEAIRGGQKDIQAYILTPEEAKTKYGHMPASEYAIDPRNEVSPEEAYTRAMLIRSNVAKEMEIPKLPKGKYKVKDFKDNLVDADMTQDVDLLNRWIREGEDYTQDKRTGAFARDLEELFDQSKTNNAMELYRGVALKGEFTEKSFTPGSTYRDSSYMFTTIQESNANAYGTSAIGEETALLKIRIPGQARVINGASLNTNVTEYIIDKDSEFTVISKKKVGNKYEIEMELIQSEKLKPLKTEADTNNEEINFEQKKNRIVKTLDQVSEEDLVRLANEKNKTTDNLRGGTWFTNKAGAEVVIDAMDPEQVSDVAIGGNDIYKATKLKMKKPLVIEDAVLDEGSFSVINSGYEDFIPKKYSQSADELYSQIMELQSEGLEGKELQSKADKIINKALADAGFDKDSAEVKGTFKEMQKQKFDSAMDLIIGKGLEESGYDGLVLKNGIQEHTFQLKGGTREMTRLDIEDKIPVRVEQEFKPLNEKEKLEMILSGERDKGVLQEKGYYGLMHEENLRRKLYDGPKLGVEYRKSSIYKSRDQEIGESIFDPVNRNLRAGKEVDKQVLRELDTAIDKTKTKVDLLLYRGVMYSEGFDRNTVFQKGVTFQDKGFSFVTENEQTAKAYAMPGHALLKINAPKGSHIINGAQFETNARQSLIARDSKYKVLDIKEEKGKPDIITLELIQE